MTLPPAWDEVLDQQVGSADAAPPGRICPPPLAKVKEVWDEAVQRLGALQGQARTEPGPIPQGHGDKDAVEAHGVGALKPRTGGPARADP